MTTPDGNTPLEKADLALRREQFDFERASKTEELSIKRREFWTSLLTVPVPLIIAALTLIVGVLNQVSAARDQLELKAAEIVMSAEGPYAAKARLAALRQLFGERLRLTFDSTLALTDMGAPGRDRRLAILQLLIEHPAQCKEVLGTADVIFPHTDFIQDLRKNPPCAAGRRGSTNP